MDLSKLSDADVKAVASGDMSKVSDEGVKAIAAGPGFLERNAQAISNMARPALEVGGTVAGGALGAAAGAPLLAGALPAGAAGAGLGFAAGKAGADLLDRTLGVKPPIGGAVDAAKETGKDLLQGAAVAAVPASATGGAFAQAAKGALTSGTANAVIQATDTGKVKPVGVVYSAALGGAVPLIAPTVGLVSRALRGASKINATAGTSIDRASADVLDEDPALLEKYKGTADAVEQRVVAIQKALIDQHKEAGAILTKARENVGIQEPFEDSLSRVQQEGFQPPKPQEIIKDFKVLSKQVYRDPNDQLGDLYRLRGKVDDMINYPSISADVPKISSADQAFLKTIRSKINEVIDVIPGGPALRKADDIYSRARTLYDDFQKAMATPGRAEDVIRNVVKGGDVDSIIGKKGEFVDMVREIEKAKGVSLLGPARSELAAKAFNEVKPTGWTGIVPASVGGKGLARSITAANHAGAAMNTAATPMQSPMLQQLMQAASAIPRR